MANLKISDLDAAAALTDSDLAELEQPGETAGTRSRKTTLADLKAYFLAGVSGGMAFEGAIDCSADPDYPAADAGDVYAVSVAGKIGGASGPGVEVGDTLLCIATAASGDHATVGASWVIAQANITGITTAGLAIMRLADPSAIRYIRINADNTVTAIDAATLASELGIPSSVEAVGTPSFSSGTLTVNCGSKSKSSHAYTLTANVTTLAFSNLAGSGNVTEFDLLLAQDGTGSRTFAFPASFKKIGDSDTAIASAANAKTLLSAKTFDNGTTWVYALQEVAA